MTKDVSQQRASGRVGCCGGMCVSRKDRDTVMPVENPSPISAQETIKMTSKGTLKTPFGNTISIDIKVNLSTISGFMFGPKSVTFNQIKKTYTEIDADVEEWKYISIFSNDNVSYDFRIRNREQAIDFIVALSDAAINLNPNFFGFTNRKLISWIMIRQKLNKMASLKDLTLHQLFLQAIYKTASEKMPESTMLEKKEKF